MKNVPLPCDDCGLALSDHDDQTLVGMSDDFT